MCGEGGAFGGMLRLTVQENHHPDSKCDVQNPIFIKQRSRPLAGYNTNVGWCNPPTVKSNIDQYIKTKHIT